MGYKSISIKGNTDEDDRLDIYIGSISPFYTLYDALQQRYKRVGQFREDTLNLIKRRPIKETPKKIKNNESTVHK